MRYLILILLSSIPLSGCVKTVYVPVSHCPEPPTIIEEALMTDKLTKESSDKDIVRAFVYDIKYLKSIKEQYKTILNGYKTPTVVETLPVFPNK